MVADQATMAGLMQQLQSMIDAKIEENRIFMQQSFNDVAASINTEKEKRQQEVEREMDRGDRSEPELGFGV